MQRKRKIVKHLLTKKLKHWKMQHWLDSLSHNEVLDWMDIVEQIKVGEPTDLACEEAVDKATWVYLNEMDLNEAPITREFAAILLRRFCENIIHYYNETMGYTVITSGDMEVMTEKKIEFNITEKGESYAMSEYF